MMAHLIEVWTQEYRDAIDRALKRLNQCDCFESGIVNGEEYQFTYCPKCGKRL
jgi:hypothetical protein